MTELVSNRTNRRLLVLAVALAGILIGGRLSAQTIGGVTAQGAITQWLLLGPYDDGPLGCNQPTGDWLTDGATIFGDEWEPQSGDTVDSDCGGAASCISWLCSYAAIGDPSIDCS